jgi:3-oxoacyl-[acyl-carrier protein] reductase
MAGNWAVISGAANGIGRATLRRFLEIGYSCMAIDKDNEALSRLNDEHRKEHKDRISCLNRDLLEIERAPEEISELSESCTGTLTLVNMIGGTFLGGAEGNDAGWDIYEGSYRFNLKPTVLLTDACIPIMREKKAGYIINISSVLGRSSFGHVGAEYSAAKAAVIGFSRKIAADYAKYNILVNTVCPGIIATDRILGLWKTRPDAVNEGVLRNIPMGRLGEPDEVARAIAFLGSCENTYITGAILDVNGGMFMP